MAKKTQDIYGEPITFNYPGAIITVRRPILTEDERARRMKRIHDAAAALILSVENRKRNEVQNGGAKAILLD